MTMPLATLTALLLVPYAALFALLMRSLCAHPHKRHYAGRKALCSAGFLAAALACTVRSGAWEQFWPLLPALLLYFAGDVLLGLYSHVRQMRLFYGGSAAFFAGHLCFALALSRRFALSGWDFLFPCAAGLGAGIVLAVLRPAGMPRSFWPAVPVYAFAVALSAGLGLHAALAGGGAAGWLLAAGTALFLVSDCIIPAVHFSPHKSLPAHVANLAAYYGGMFCIALSLAFAS